MSSTGWGSGGPPQDDRPPAGGPWHEAQPQQYQQQPQVWPNQAVVGYGVPGVDAAALAILNRKSVGAAVLLSLVFTGAGQWYCGRIGRGFAFLGAAVVSSILMLALIGFLLLPLVWVWALIDSIMLANRHNEYLAHHLAGRHYA